MNAMTSTRREFTAGIGAIVVAFSLDPKLALAQRAAPLPGSLAKNRMLDAWIRINAEGNATIFPGKVELGQGITTALTQIAAEELDLPLGRVRVLTTDTSRSPNEGVTSGSQSIEYGGTALRLASAEVRGILLDLAAKRLAVSADTLTVADGTIGSADGRKVGYGELAAEVDLHREAMAKVAPKSPATHKIVGKSIPRFDIPNKVTGGVAYAQDMRLPGMMHGRIVRPPRPGSKLDSVDEAAVKAMPGVIAVVRDGSFLGVVAEREEQAIKARQALINSAKWTLGPELPDPAKIYDVLLALPTEDNVISDKQAPLPEGAQVIEATYRKPYMAHASIGPSCALAEFKNGKMTVWTHSQGVFPLRDHLSLGFIFKRSVISHEKPIGLPRSTAPDKNIRVFVARDFEHFLTVILSIVLPNCDPDCLKLY
jgi:CO/xanthine dehydrogenase Mo-binding subunit